jgi:hypothetical protein
MNTFVLLTKVQIELAPWNWRLGNPSCVRLATEFSREESIVSRGSYLRIVRQTLLEVKSDERD